MKSPEVYALLRSEIGPWFKAGGFKRAKGLLSWWRPHGPACTVVWCQVSQDGWDAWAGSQFVVEFQRSVEPVPGAHPSRSARLARLLSSDAREELRTLQNAVLAGLKPAPASHPVLNVSESLTRWYLKKFEPVSEPYSEADDVWLRYASPDHVAQWGRFLLSWLPTCVAEVESWV